MSVPAYPGAVKTSGFDPVREGRRFVDRGFPDTQPTLVTGACACGAESWTRAMRLFGARVVQCRACHRIGRIGPRTPAERAS